MANNLKRIIKEDGIVLEKIFKEATSEFKAQDGRVIAAQPDRYILRCVSGEDFSKENGFSQSNMLDFKVDKQVYDKAVAYSPVTVRYEMSNFGVKAESVALKDNK